LFFFSSRRRHTRSYGDWSSDVCSSDLIETSSTNIGNLAIGESGNRVNELTNLPTYPITKHTNYSSGMMLIRRPRPPWSSNRTRRSEERRVGKEWRWRRWDGCVRTEHEA